MKGLLHSKRFRKNLKKWLCMYIGAIMLLTTVITYSKYISKYNVTDNARVTKFDVKISNITNNYNCTQKEEAKEEFSCKINLETEKPSYRPTEEIAYEFSVEPDFEVNTILVVTLNVDKDNFIIQKLEEIGENKETIATLYEYKKEESPVVVDGVSTENLANGKISFTNNIKVTDENRKEKRNYRITIKYNYLENKFLNDTTGENKKTEEMSTIKINYSAKQEKTDVLATPTKN